MRGDSLNLLSQFLRTLAKYVEDGDKALKEYVNRLIQELPESTIVLFGSRARGDYLPNSDYDVAVILRQVSDVHSELLRLRSLKPEGLFLDLTILSIDDLDDPVIKEMLKGCKLLYDGLGINNKLGCMLS
ncbi:nucleotidyltransferase domain-containing protein [Vulcanisaeta moutnovskia]|uniref:nucleotidyltransferase domain-containing protein n=1 Tax=Vulcanisaeta moutnovskia TaxID=985052 RepID=UPI001ED934C3|nr:nucleotidyltransferase domain-containing protein [Vulcanisaeta moutnovskia]